MTAGKVYISGALMGARDLGKAKELYAFVATVCSKVGYEPYLPHLNTDPIANNEASDAEVFSKDYAEMIDSELVISYIGEPSLGVGAELSICVSRNIRVITFVERQRKVSRFLKGMLEASTNAEQIEFNDYQMLEEKLATSLLQHLKKPH